VSVQAIEQTNLVDRLMARTVAAPDGCWNWWARNYRAKRLINPGKWNKGTPTHCSHGHERTPTNTYMQNGYPVCRQCVLDRQLRARNAARKAS
jgi:hypothetical protein